MDREGIIRIEATDTTAEERQLQVILFISVVLGIVTWTLRGSLWDGAVATALAAGILGIGWVVVERVRGT